METSEVDLYDTIRFDERLTRLVELIESVNRPGEFCTHGRLFAPMPRVVAGGRPTLSFPVPASQAEALIAGAERAPYGKGQETLVNASVRNCWQLGPARVRVEGRTWKKTLDQIVERTAEGLGFPAGGIRAEFYKLLVYEPGGFFVRHRDTEKTERMVATLVIALPTAGAGGTLLARHHGREVVVDMQTDEPSELIHAAVYADCEHEIRPVTEGHRISLVYNLVRRKKAQVAAAAPDHRTLVTPLATELAARFRNEEERAKLVWVLEHDYSEAGLSFDNLKNVDRAVAEVVAAAAEQAGCALFAAILHTEQTDGVMVYHDVYADDDPDEEDFEVTDTIDFGCWLDGWVSPDGTAPGYGKLRLQPDELMPADRMDLDRPDSQRLTEATGNGGATIEHLYRSAALVAWPRARTLSAIAPAGPKAILNFLATEKKRVSAEPADSVGMRELAAQVAEIWPAPFHGSAGDQSWLRHTVAAMDLLGSVGNPEATMGFLAQVVAPHYRSELDGALAAAAAELGAARMRGLLPDLVRQHLPQQPAAVVELIHKLAERFGKQADPEWREALRETTRALGAAATTLGASAADAKNLGYGFGYRTEPVTLSSGDLARFYGLVWKFDLEDEAAAATEWFIARRELVAPDRTVPELLDELRLEWPARAGGSPAFTALWSHAASFVLSRSGVFPAPPADWTLPAGKFLCECEHCAGLRAFCVHPEATVHRVRAAQWARDHLTDRIAGSDLDLRHETEKRNRPYTLVVFKTRATYERRFREYEADVEAMRRLLAVTDAVADSGPRAAELAAALARAG